MSERPKEKLTVQVDSALLADFKALAQSEGRQLQSLVEEAIINLIQERKTSGGRAHVMAAYRKTLERYAPLFEKLAKS